MIALKCYGDEDKMKIYKEYEGGSRMIEVKITPRDLISITTGEECIISGYEGSSSYCVRVKMVDEE